MSFSRFIAILSALGAAAAASAAGLERLKPSYALGLLLASVAINAFTERVQGGASKIKSFPLTPDEINIIRNHREQERNKDDQQ
jgi:hypothetical protein